MPSNLKKRVRERMQKTGESYETALLAVKAEETRPEDPGTAAFVNEMTKVIVDDKGARRLSVLLDEIIPEVEIFEKKITRTGRVVYDTFLFAFTTFLDLPTVSGGLLIAVQSVDKVIVTGEIRFTVNEDSEVSVSSGYGPALDVIPETLTFPPRGGPAGDQVKSALTRFLERLPDAHALMAPPSSTGETVFYTDQMSQSEKSPNVQTTSNVATYLGIGKAEGVQWNDSFGLIEKAKDEAIGIISVNQNRASVENPLDENLVILVVSKPRRVVVSMLDVTDAQLTEGARLMREMGFTSVGLVTQPHGRNLVGRGPKDQIVEDFEIHCLERSAKELIHKLTDAEPKWEQNQKLFNQLKSVVQPAVIRSARTLEALGIHLEATYDGAIKLIFAVSSKLVERFYPNQNVQGSWIIGRLIFDVTPEGQIAITREVVAFREAFKDETHTWEIPMQALIPTNVFNDMLNILTSKLS